MAKPTPGLLRAADEYAYHTVDEWPNWLRQVWGLPLRAGAATVTSVPAPAVVEVCA